MLTEFQSFLVISQFIVLGISTDITDILAYVAFLFLSDTRIYGGII